MNQQCKGLHDGERGMETEVNTQPMPASMAHTPNLPCLMMLSTLNSGCCTCLPVACCVPIWPPAASLERWVNTFRKCKCFLAAIVEAQVAVRTALKLVHTVYKRRNVARGGGSLIRWLSHNHGAPLTTACPQPPSRPGHRGNGAACHRHADDHRADIGIMHGLASRAKSTQDVRLC